MEYQYPFPSMVKKYCEQEPYSLNNNETVPDVDLEKYIETLRGPIIELGGPSKGGYYFIDGLSLPTKPLISNVQDDGHSINPTDPEIRKVNQLIDLEIDGTDMPFDDASVGMVMMSYMSHTDDSYLNLPQHEKDELLPVIVSNLDTALLEMAQISDGTLDPQDARLSQRTLIYLESFRVLEPGGLLVANGQNMDISVLEQIGFNLVEKIKHPGWPDDDPEAGYDFVVRKPGLDS